MNFDQRALRDAFGCFATGVTVITTNPENQPVLGMTANSFSSVSLDPPLVLWCLGKESDCLGVFETVDNFAINILSAEQEDLSNHCAKQGDHSLDDFDWRAGATGAPILDGVLATLDCEVAQRIDAGDHIIMLGKVVDLIDGTGKAPLIFSQGRYRTLA